MKLFAVAALLSSIGFVLTSGARAAQQGTVGRPPVFGVAHVAIRVTDLGAARRFYGGLLGYPELPPADPRSPAVFVVNDRQRIVVHPTLAANQTERLHHLAFETADVQAMAAYLASKGLTLRDTFTDDAGGGRSIEVADADGHTVRFIQRDPRTSQAPPGDPDRRISRRILHAGLTVRNAAAADTFYKEILGFSEIWRGGRTDDLTSWINMRVPDGTDYLEYMLITGPVDRNQLGSLHHVALVVPDIQEALETARMRAPDSRNARATPQIGRNRRWQLNLYDPDGTRVEFMEPWTMR